MILAVRTMILRPFHPAAALAVVLLSGLLLVVADLSPTPSIGAEGRFFALWVAFALLPASSLERRGGHLLPAAVLGLAAIALMPGLGGARSTAFGAILALTVVGLVVGAYRRGQLFEPGNAVAAAIAAQVLFRSERLLTLTLSLEDLVTFIALPLVAGLALAWLARQAGTPLAAVAAAAAVSLGPGLGVLAVCTLVAAAAVAGERPAGWPRAATLAAAVLAAGAREPIAALVLATAFVPVLLRASPWSGLGASALGMAALAALRMRSGLIAADLLPENPVAVLWAVPVVGILVIRAPASALALALAASAGIAALGMPAGLIPAAVGGACLVGRPFPVERASVSWSAALLGASTVIAAYPWLRARPLETVLDQIVPGNGVGIVATVALVACFGLLALRLEKASSWAAPTLAAIAALAWAVTAGAPPVVSSEPAFTLTADRASRQVDLPSQARTRLLWIDGFLGHAFGVEEGTVVAVVDLELRDGRTRRRTLKLGLDSGDWAARPAGLTPWRFAVGADGRSLTALYRTRWELGETTPIKRLRVSRPADLPTDLEVSIERILLFP